MKQKRKTQKKKDIEKKWFQKRSRFSHTNLLAELKVSAPDDYKNFLRMTDCIYQELLEMITPAIKKEDTVMRDAISVGEHLSTTLRFLATGQSFEDLKFLTAQTIGKPVKQ